MPSYRAGRTALDAMRAHGLRSAIKLASNESPFGPLPSVHSAIAVCQQVNRYPEVSAATLRARIAEHHGIPEAAVSVGAGSAALLWQLAWAFLEEADTVVFPWPSFEAYPLLARLSGAHACSVALDRSAVDVDALATVALRGAKLTVVAEPNNPTGSSLGAERLRDLISRLPESTLVIVDQAYHEFNAARDDALVRDAAERFSNVAVLRTFSKAHGLAALRVGYLVASPSVAEVVQRVAVPFAVNSVAAAAACASLDSQGELCDRVAYVVDQRSRLERRIRNLGLGVPISEGNFVWLPAGVRSSELSASLETAGVVTRAVDGHGVRVTIGTAEDNETFLAALSTSVTSTDVTAGWTFASGPLACRAGALLDADAQPWPRDLRVALALASNRELDAVLAEDASAGEIAVRTRNLIQ